MITVLDLESHFEKLGEDFCFDTETAMAPASFGGWTNVRLLQFANEDGYEFYLDTLELGRAELRYIKEFLERKTLTITCQNAAFDCRVMRGCGVYLGGKPSADHLPNFYDSFIASQVLYNGNSLKHDLGSIVKRELEVELDKSLQKNDWMNAELNEAELAYAMADVRYTLAASQTLHSKIVEQGLYDVYRLECSLISCIVEMEHTGMYVDPDALSECVSYYEDTAKTTKAAFIGALHERLIDAGHEGLPLDEDGSFNLRAKPTGTVRAGTKKPAGFNINAPKQVLEKFSVLGFQPTTEAGKPSLDRKVLAVHQSEELVRMLLSFKRVNKRQQMAESLQESCGEDHRIRARFNPLATATGRFSCVAGSTILITSRGDFRFDEYLPQEGDLVLSHQGRWMPVIRKIYRGIEDMYTVVTESGGKLTCTGDHMLRTCYGWERVSNMLPGIPVEYFKELGQPRGEHQRGDHSLQGRGQTSDLPYSQGVGNHPPQHSTCSGNPSASRRVHGGESTSVLTLQARHQEPDDRKEWFPAPQLQGVGAGLQGLSDGTKWQGWPGVPTPSVHGSSTWGGDTPPTSGGASHRWGRLQQLFGQPRAGNCEGAQLLTPSETRVVSIDFVGPMGVWDIEVMGDHSYATYGFLNHNCSSPNLQQVPRDKEFRCAFKAPAGRVLVVADFSGMELRIAAVVAGEQRMLDAFNEGADIHTRTTALMYGIPEGEVDKPRRNAGKSSNFGLLYAAGPKGLVNYFATVGIFISLKEGREFHKMWHEAYPAFGKWHRQCDARARAKSPSFTIIGRRRYMFSTDTNSVTTQSNSVIQGTGADITKAAMIEIHRKLPETARLIGTIHDEILIECDEADGESVLKMMLAEMEDAGLSVLGNGVRLIGEGSVAPSWGEAK
jgi:DNA polymerase I-like protein with 3'-5' exonuclease and polymerase domains